MSGKCLKMSLEFRLKRSSKKRRRVCSLSLDFLSGKDMDGYIFVEFEFDGGG